MDKKERAGVLKNLEKETRTTVFYEAPHRLTDTLKALLETYFDVILGAANEDNVTVDKNQQIELQRLGETVNGTLYTFQPTAADVEQMLLKLADTLEKDEDLQDFILSLAGDNLDLVEQMFGTDDLDGLLQAGLSDAAASLRESVAVMGQTVADSGFVWTVGYADGRVCYQRLGFEDQDAAMVYESMGDEQDGRRDAFYVLGYGGANTMAMETEYTKVDGLYTGSLVMEEWDETILSMTFDQVDEDTRSALGAAYGTYGMVFDNYGTPMTLYVTVGAADSVGTDHRFTLDDGSGTFDGYALNLWTSDKKATVMEPFGTPVDITTLDDSDLEELGMLLQQDFMEAFMPLIMGMESMGT